MISGKTKTVGLIGNPVEHSISPAMHNAAFEEKNLDYVYVAFQVKKDSLSDAISGIRSLGIEGVNVTIPHKTTVIRNLDEVVDTARKIGAVNTIKKKGNKLIGFNTDGIGALKSLQNEIGKIDNRKTLLLGAGGAARAIAFTLVEAGAKLTISNRTLAKGEKLAEEIKEKTGRKTFSIPQKRSDLAKVIKETEILINSTSVGMHPDEDKALVKSDAMHKNLIVMDVVYNPLQTRLLKEAEKAGAKTINGLEMLVHQGVASFEIWTGEKAPTETMKKAAKKALEVR
ncbi:shikimate dehydrogenase [candidate division MSBL1 archaeon SCGC-AAA259I09]|uniref:Shikimate dehydrogenase (NADP(+)) n=2 Tax=candidate division MSBL1 TaxID=215777 RepID=A0A133UU63_9EURY|nr:shikimate dehydrogenase [candidate division MSBL1 archaeon SCGC-AAA259I09]KXA98805.1 shikimate dehydrogenase [candidate division MSBL1 archaeon SCGC-AAA259J03]